MKIISQARTWLVLILLTLDCITALKRRALLKPTHMKWRESRIFEEKGKIMLQTSFGHLRMNLKIDQVIQSYSSLWEMVARCHQIQSKGNLGANNYQLQTTRFAMRQAIQNLFAVLGLVVGQTDHGDQVLRTWVRAVKDIDERFNNILSQTKSDPDQDRIVPQPELNLTSIFPSEILQPEDTDRESNNAEPTGVDHPRNKRQLLVGAAVVGSLVAFGLSIYDTYQLEKIHSAINLIHDESTILAAEIDQQGLKIQEIMDWCTATQEATEAELDRIELLQLEVTFNEMLEDLHIMEEVFLHQLDDYIKGIVLLQDQRLSPLLIKPKMLKDAYTKLLEQAEDRLLRPVSVDANIVFQSATSVVAEMGKDSQKLPSLFAIVHIPFYSGMPMTLYRYHSTPILVDDALIRFEGVDYLATTPEGEEVREMTSEDVASCLKIGRVYHCNHQNVMNRNIEDLCLPSLFFNRNPTQICDVTVAKAKAYAHQIAEGSFIYSSTEPFTVTKYCPGASPSYQEYEKGTFHISMTENCSKYTTEDFIMFHNPEMAVQAELVKKVIDFDPSMIEEDVPKGWSVNQAVLDHFKNSPALKPLNLKLLKERLAKDEVQYAALHMGMAGTTAVVILITIMIILCIGLYWWKCCRRAKREDLQPKLDDLDHTKRRLTYNLQEEDEEKQRRETLPLRHRFPASYRRNSTPHPTQESPAIRQLLMETLDQGLGTVEVDAQGQVVTFQASSPTLLVRQRHRSGGNVTQREAGVVELERKNPTSPRGGDHHPRILNPEMLRQLQGN